MQQNFFDPEEHSDMFSINPVNFFETEAEDTLAEALVPLDLSDLHEDGLAASVEALDKALILMNYRDTIKRQGIGVIDVASIENHVPGLLRHQPPKPFTYRRSDVNLEYSVEAIDGKIADLMKDAGKMFARIIDWIIERLDKLTTWFKSKKYIERVKYIQTALRSRGTVIGLSEARNYMGAAEFDAYWKRKVTVSDFNQIFKSDLNVEDMSGLRNGAGLVDIASILSKKKGNAPRDYNNLREVDGKLTKCFGQIVLIAQRIENAKVYFSPRMAKAGADFSNPRDEVVGEIEIPKRIDLSEFNEILQTDPTRVNNCLNKISTLKNNVEGTKRYIKELDRFVSDGTPESIAAYKKFRASLYDALRNVQTLVQYCSDCMVANYVAAKTIGVISLAMTKGSIQAYKEQDHG